MKNRKLHLSQVIPACLFSSLVLSVFGADLPIPAGTYTEKYFNSIDGDITASNVIVDDPGNMKLTAGQTIKLQTGFKVNAGSLFHARILQDPKTEGPYSYNTSPIYYASYGAQKIARYQSPTTSYTVSQRLDMHDFPSAMSNDGYSYWGFNEYSFPVNGIIRMPTSGSGPYPLVVFVHGDHPEGSDYSDEGYDYLCKLLASWGCISVSIDENFLNWTSGHNIEGRAILLLEHVKQFKTWNELSGHPLYGKVDMDKIILVGHSKGGQAVARASYYNTLTSANNGFGPYEFTLKGIVSIAPTSKVVTESVEDNYFMMTGSRDNDVYTIEGQKIYDKAHVISSNPVISAEGFKSLLYIHGANHNCFNSSWDAEVTEEKILLEVTGAISAGASFSEAEELEEDLMDGLPTLTRGEQENVAKVYIGALVQTLLLGNTDYQELFKDHDFGRGWLPDSDDYVSQYQGRERLFINHYEEDTNPYTLSAGSGSNSWSGVDVDEILFDSGASSMLYQETKGVKLSWTLTGGYYQTSFSSGYELDASGFDFIAIRIGQSEESNNAFDVDQDFTIQIEDDSSNIVSFAASSLSRLIYPDRGAVRLRYSDDLEALEPYRAINRRTVMQTIRIPLGLIAAQGVDITDISSIKFIMDQTSSGTIYFDELQLTN